MTIASARSQADGSTATVVGVLTTALGALESGRTAFLQDETGGIALYLSSAVVAGPSAGTLLRATGTLDDRYGQRTLRVDLDAIEIMAADATLPSPVTLPTGDAGEADEGRRVDVTGTIVETPTSLADGTGLLIDDGTGPLRVVASALALGDATPARGSIVRAFGPLGQRDSSGLGTAGYRVYATEPGELLVGAPPTPTPEPSVTPDPSPEPTSTPEPSPSPTPEPTASPTPEPSPSPTPAPSPTPTSTPNDLTLITIADARTYPVGSRVRTSGVVIAEAGRLGRPSLAAIQDGEAGIAVRLSSTAPEPARGSRVEVTGTLAQSYGQLELRVEDGRLLVVGEASLPIPLAIAGAELGEAVEGRLVVAEGLIESSPTKATSGDIAAYLTTADGVKVRLAADGSSGLTTASLSRGSGYRVAGVAGQRASRRGALDGYRIWIRDANDLQRLDSPSPSASATPAPSASATPTDASGGSSAVESGVVSIARALLVRGAAVHIAGIVTVGPALLDASGRRIVIEDSSGAVEIWLPADAPTTSIGEQVEATGTMTRAYGAPRLRATSITRSGRGMPTARDIRLAPGAAHEWRLVRVSGTIVDVRRLGARWTAELMVGEARIPIVGLAASGIASTSLRDDRQATIVGIVRRPYPSSKDRRFAIVPRSPADVALGPASASGSAGPSTGSASRSGPDGRSASTGRLTDRRAGSGADTTGESRDVPLDVDLGQLDEHIGALVRVGGLVVEVESDGIVIDDGTARGRIALRGEAAGYLALIEPGDALNAIGRGAIRADRPEVVVDDPAGLMRVGDLGEPVAIAALAPSTGSGETRSSPVPAVSAGEDVSSAGIPRGQPGGQMVPAVAWLGLVSLGSIGAALLRRRRRRRRLARRVSARLASVVRHDQRPA